MMFATDGPSSTLLKTGWPAWKRIALQAWNEASDDNVGLIAAGVAFYAFLAIVPLLGAIVLSYGLIADTKTVVHDMQGLTSVMPADAARLVGEQLKNVVETSGSKKGLGLLLAIALALFGARSAAGSIVTALNIAYEEKERRSFVVVNLLALAMTAGAVLVAVLAIVAIAALGHLEKLLPSAPGFVVVLGKVVTYVAFALAGAAGAATLYRYGPSRGKRRWTWLTPGSVFSSAGWLLLTLGFGLYVSHLGNYNATYGSLGAVVVLLTWLSLSVYILLLGAEINSELEREVVENPAENASKRPGEGGVPQSHDVPGNGTRAALELTRPVDNPARKSALSTLATGYVVSRVTTRVGAVAGTGKIGMASAGIATIGLTMIQRSRRGGLGVVLLTLAAGLGWIARHDAKATRRLQPPDCASDRSALI